MTETLVFAVATGLVLGFGACLVFVTWRDITPLQRELTDTRRLAKRWKRCSDRWEVTATIWRDRARLAERIHELEREALGIKQPVKRTPLTAVGSDPRD